MEASSSCAKSDSAPDNDGEPAPPPQIGSSGSTAPPPPSSPPPPPRIRRPLQGPLEALRRDVEELSLQFGGAPESAPPPDGSDENEQETEVEKVGLDSTEDAAQQQGGAAGEGANETEESPIVENGAHELRVAFPPRPSVTAGVIVKAADNDGSALRAYLAPVGETKRQPQPLHSCNANGTSCGGSHLRSQLECCQGEGGVPAADPRDCFGEEEAGAAIRYQGASPPPSRHTVIGEFRDSQHSAREEGDRSDRNEAFLSETPERTTALIAELAHARRCFHQMRRERDDALQRLEEERARAAELAQRMGRAAETAEAEREALRVCIERGEDVRRSQAEVILKCLQQQQAKGGVLAAHVGRGTISPYGYCQENMPAGAATSQMMLLTKEIDSSDNEQNTSPYSDAIIPKPLCGAEATGDMKASFLPPTPPPPLQPNAAGDAARGMKVSKSRRGKKEGPHYHRVDTDNSTIGSPYAASGAALEVNAESSSQRRAVSAAKGGNSIGNRPRGESTTPTRTHAGLEGKCLNRKQGPKRSSLPSRSGSGWRKRSPPRSRKTIFS